MKHIKNNFLIFSFLALTISSPAFASGAKLPLLDLGNGTTTTGTDTPVPGTPTSGTGSNTTPTPTSGAYADAITQMAGSSTCASYSWASRGKAPAGYIKGVALSFARSICRTKNQSALSKIMSAANSGNTTKDAVAYYDSTFASLPIVTSSAGLEPLRALYTLGMGLGMRESSGVYCEGWDRSAGSNRSSAAGEAGLFQTSYDSIGLSAELSKLYAEYQANPGKCMLDVFKQGASCSSLSNLGTGAGATYQAFNKACPAFATEYAMTMLRISRSHYGPIIRKEAQVVPACNNLLKSVQDMVTKDPYACDDLI